MNKAINNIQQANSNFFTNRNGNTLMKEFEGVLQHNDHIKNLDAVVGFLRASGYFSLRPFLDHINKVRVLIGIDVDKYIAQAARQGTIERHGSNCFMISSSTRWSLELHMK